MKAKSMRAPRGRLLLDSTVPSTPLSSPRQPGRRPRTDASHKRGGPPSLVIPQTARAPAVQHGFTREASPRDIPPHARILSDIPVFLQRCREFSDYPICQLSPATFEPHPPIPAFNAKAEALNVLLAILNEPSLRATLPKEFYRELFSTLEPDLRRSIPAFRPPNTFSEVPVIYIIKNWTHVLVAHRIVQSIIQDRFVFTPLFEPAFAAGLVHQLDTPVFEEREEVETALHILMADYAGFRRPMLRIMLAKLVAYLDGVKYLTLSIAPILRLLITYFSTLNGPIKQSNYLLFRTVFYPLFAMELADLYESALVDLCGYFQTRDPATAFWCLRYLKTHWPCTSTPKQMLFFRQAIALIPMLPMTMFDSVGPVILRALKRCVMSEHFQVALNAAVFCSTPQFLELFRSIPDEVTKFLLFSARTASAHWNPEAREVAAFLVDAVREFEIASKPATRRLTAKNPRRKGRLGWFEIVDLAVEADEGLDREQERAKVEAWLGRIGTWMGTS
jgi:hypothetical protein